jgi:hypothetical protein
MVHGAKINRENKRFAITGFAVGYFPHRKFFPNPEKARAGRA